MGGMQYNHLAGERNTLSPTDLPDSRLSFAWARDNRQSCSPMSASDPGPAAGADAQATETLTPTLLNQRIRKRLVDLRNLRVRGEVSQPRYSNGHLYFTLKDQSSNLPVTVWRTQVQRMKLRLRSGDEVICRGQVEHYVPSGRVSFIAWHVRAAGVGALWAKFQRLKEQLQKEGLFDNARKKPLPVLPKTIGIVTSPTGAALRDMLRILGDRMATRVIVAPSKVQGPDAPSQIATAISALDQTGLCDVIICGRGGGSIEDLWAFNEELVVRAVAACSTPIVSAVGHETDTLLSDFAADVRAPTPTAGAEIVVPKRDDLLARIDENRRRIGTRTGQILRSERQRMCTLQLRLGTGDNLLLPARQATDELRMRLLHAQQQRLSIARRRHEHLRNRLQSSHPLAQLRRRRTTIVALQKRLARAGPTQLLAMQRRLLAAQATLKALNPRAALRRGYAIVRHGDTGEALRRADEVAVDHKVRIVLSEGELDAAVTAIHPEST